jgi:hypothetical protein
VVAGQLQVYEVALNSGREHDPATA